MNGIHPMGEVFPCTPQDIRIPRYTLLDTLAARRTGRSSGSAYNLLTRRREVGRSQLFHPRKDDTSRYRTGFSKLIAGSLAPCFLIIKW